VVVTPPDHACLLAVSEEQRAEVAADFVAGERDVVCFGFDLDWLRRRLAEDHRPPVEQAEHASPCGAVVTLWSTAHRLCLFDNDTLTGTRRAEVLAGHDGVVAAPALFDDGTLRITRVRDGLRFAGELDVANRHAMRVVREAAPDAIDVGSLRFLDAGGAVALYAATHQRMRLLRPRLITKRVVELLDPRAERLVCVVTDHG
jgi:hypothetical protein